MMYILFYGICFMAMVGIFFLLIRYYDSDGKKCFKSISKTLFCLSILLFSILVIDLFI